MDQENTRKCWNCPKGKFFRHQLYIINVSADADFIRVMVGDIGLTRGKRVGRILNEWIITPFQPQNEHVYLGNMKRSAYKSKRVWVAFEAVRRGKKNETVGTFVALSSRPSMWRTKMGALTHFDIKAEAIVPNAKLNAHWQKAIQ